jgi:NAD(P)H-nitrite reductase large subunit
LHSILVLDSQGGNQMANNENMIICRCEEVTYGQLRTTVDKHKCTARELKLRTRAGMGFCGGRTCRPILDQVLESFIPHFSPSEIPLKYQPPIRPVSFGRIGEIHD